MNILPPFLKPGDQISIIAPSGKVNPDYVTGMKSKLESWGFKVECGEHIFDQFGRFAGTKEARLFDLQKALDNPENKAVYCARGGYGVVHLLDDLSLDIFKKSPKWLIGYSDITALHATINNEGICSIHAPMSSHLSEEDENDKSNHFLKELLAGTTSPYTIESHPLNREGITKGILRGGNLSVLYSLRGTTFDFNPTETILFVEDICEQAYHIERMMYNLKLGGILKNISGLIIGQFTDCEEDESMNKSIYQSIRDLVEEYNYPVCFNFPVGHTKKNYPLISGREISLEINESKTMLS